jgi:hypothetical protein
MGFTNLFLPLFIYLYLESMEVIVCEYELACNGFCQILNRWLSLIKKVEQQWLSKRRVEETPKSGSFW